MKTMFRLLLAGAAAFALTTAAEARPFTARDMATLDRVSDPRVSPDGRYVIYAQRVVDYDANKARQELWLVDLKAAAPTARKLEVSEGGVVSARWAADSKTIYFLSARGGSMQVWRTEVGLTTAGQVTSMPFDVGAFRLSPDGRKLLVSQPMFPNCDTLACTKERLDARAAKKTTGVVHDRLFIRHWDEWADGTRNHVFALTLDEKGLTADKPVDVTRGFDGDIPEKPFGDEGGFVFTPDSSGVVFSARLAGRSEPWSTNFDLYRVGLDGANLTNLTEANPAWDSGPVFSPDGKTLAYRAMKRPGFEADRWQIVLMDVATGARRELAADWDRSPDSLDWSADGKTLYVTAGDVGQTRVFAVDVARGKVTAVTGPGHVPALSIAGRTLVYAQDTLTTPGQLFRLDLGKRGAQPAQITQANADRLADLDMGAAEQFSFPGWNGETVHGYLVKPANFDPAKKYPVAFLIHGGPQGSFGNLFHYRWNAQTYAGAGYAVVMIDFHGSTGYGQAFTDAISQHWGDRPLEDLQKGWAYALANYGFLDGDRACALGGSYGGFMINWIAGNWSQPWKCLVNHDGIFDSRFMAYSTEELWFSEWENGGTPWTPGTTYSTFNPADHVANWNTPMLVVHGGLDFRVPLEEGIATFTALQRRGVESKLLYFPNENHWVLRPQNSVQWHDEVQGWLNAHTQPK